MKRVLSVLLSLVILIGCFSGVGYAQNTSDNLCVLYIPIDDRPFNDERVRLMAGSLDVELLMPEKSLYATTLDSQTEEGCSGGDRGALMDWLMAHQDEADVLILSLDQLLSGGLMNSRAMTEMTKLTLGDGTEMTEEDVIDYIAGLAQSKTVYVIDSVQRLASNYGFGGYTLKDYNLTRLYGVVARPKLTGSALTVDNIVKNYRLAADGSQAYLSAGFSQEDRNYFLGSWGTSTVSGFEATEDPQLGLNVLKGIAPEAVVETFAQVSVMESEEASDSLLSRYLSIRERKLRLTAYALDKLNLSGVHYLLGVDDSASGEQIQSNELRYFAQHMGSDDQLLSALDGLGQMALAKAYQEFCGAGAVKVHVTTIGYDASVTGGFNYKSTSENISQVLNYYGCKETEEQGDIDLILYAGVQNDSERKANLGVLVSTLNENEADGIPTILVDMTEGAKSLMRELPLDSVHMGALLSYSGITENPGQVHMGLNQGLARYFALCNDTPLTTEAQNQHLENLLSTMTEEVYDTSPVLDNMYQFIAGLGQSEPMVYPTEQQLSSIYEEVQRQMNTYMAPLLNSFTSSNFTLSLKYNQSAGITKAVASDIYYPWLRQFEIWGTYDCEFSGTTHDYGTLHRRTVYGSSLTDFYAGEPLTREQAARMLVMFTQQEVPEGLKCPFDDVADWAKDCVALAAQKKYVSGCDDGNFQGSREMTRAEFAAMLWQYAKAENITLEKKKNMSFSDVPQDAWYKQVVYALANAGIIAGTPEGTFDPDGKLTREAAVSLLCRMFGRTEQLPEGLMELQRFVDMPTEHWAYRDVQDSGISHFEKS